jgi:hypothetical protein
MTTSLEKRRSYRRRTMLSICRKKTGKKCLRVKGCKPTRKTMKRKSYCRKSKKHVVTGGWRRKEKKRRYGTWNADDHQKSVLEILRKIVIDPQNKQITDPQNEQITDGNETKTKLYDADLEKFYMVLYVNEIQKIKENDPDFDEVIKNGTFDSTPICIIYLCRNEDRKGIPQKNTLSSTKYRNTTLNTYCVYLFNDKYIVLPLEPRYENDPNPNSVIAPINSFLHLQKGQWFNNSKSKDILQRLQKIATDYNATLNGSKNIFGYNVTYQIEQTTKLKDRTIAQFYTGLYVANIEKVNNNDARFKNDNDESSNKPEKPEYVIYLCLNEDRKDVTNDRTGFKNLETMSKFIVLLYNDKYILMTHNYGGNANDCIVPTEGAGTIAYNSLMDGS